jgi:hypothetical protein
MIHYLGIPLAKRALKDSLFSPAEQTSFGLFFFFYYSHVHTRLGSFLPPAPTPSSFGLYWVLFCFWWWNRGLKSGPCTWQAGTPTTSTMPFTEFLRSLLWNPSQLGNNSKQDFYFKACVVFKVLNSTPSIAHQKICKKNVCDFCNKSINWAWWYMSIIPAFRRLRQED